MAGGMKFRDPRTGVEVEQEDPKIQRILEQGGFVKVTSATPKLVVPEPEPSTVPEHVAANKAAEKAAAAEKAPPAKESDK